MIGLVVLGPVDWSVILVYGVAMIAIGPMWPGAPKLPRTIFWRGVERWIVHLRLLVERPIVARLPRRNGQVRADVLSRDVTGTKGISFLWIIPASCEKAIN